jgi:hypothetical protein
MRIGLADIANLIERRYPALASVLISAVRFAAGEVGSPETSSPTMMAAVVDRAGRDVGGIDFGVVLDPRRARRSVLAIGAIVVVYAGMAVAAPELTALWFARNVLLQDVPWPKRTHLVVGLEGDELLAARGDDVVIEAYANGVQPRSVEFFYETSSARRGQETMVTVGSPGSYRYRYTFRNAQEDFTFHLEGGDDRTGSFPVRLLERPRVRQSEMHVVPPAYTGMDSFRLGDGERAAQVLPGSDVTIRILPSKPVTRAVLTAGRKPIGEAVKEGKWYAVTTSPVETHTYHFKLVDEVGLENRRPVRFSIRVIRDEPPRLRMRLSGVGDMITPRAVLPIELECEDTYGLAVVELVSQVLREGASERPIPLPAFRPHAKVFKTSLRWPVESESVEPGERLTLLARAADFDDVSGPNFTQSPDVTLRVVTPEELLAEFARREQAYRMTFERLVETQEQLRGRLLTARGQLERAGPGQARTIAIAPLERQQRNIVGSVNVLRQQFEQLLAELRVNQLDTREEEQRLQEGIADPLAQLARRDLITASDTIRRWSRDRAPETASLIDAQQIAVISQMRAVLAHMIQWEGYQEVVNMLRDIIRLQKELGDEAERALLESASDVFDD